MLLQSMVLAHTWSLHRLFNDVNRRIWLESMHIIGEVWLRCSEYIYRASARVLYARRILHTAAAAEVGRYDFVIWKDRLSEQLCAKERATIALIVALGSTDIQHYIIVTDGLLCFGWREREDVGCRISKVRVNKVQAWQEVLYLVNNVKWHEQVSLHFDGTTGLVQPTRPLLVHPFIIRRLV